VLKYTQQSNDRKYQEVRFGEKDENPCSSQKILDAES
jgi:hypothetical protein